MFGPADISSLPWRFPEINFMKSFLLILFLCTAFVGFSAAPAAAQSKSKTIILVRHAEKDTSETADSRDPELSAEGRSRSERLTKLLRRYRPGAVYSSNFKRTRDTVEGISQHRKKPIQVYDPRDPKKLVGEVMASGTKRFVISGHSNTIPPLANLLIGKELFKELDESEYGTIWIIRLKEGRQPKIEILSY